MPIVTITSDWNNQDYYAGSIKGRIVSLVPDANIIDINHNIPAFKLAQAAFIVRNTYKNFPAKTIHLLCINSEQSADKKHLIVKYDDHYFLSTDNGILGLVCNDDEKIAEVYEYKDEIENKSFSVLDAFPVMVKAITENTIKNIANKKESFDRHVPMRPVFEDNVISGSVIYIDSYKNIITNITRTLFNDVGKNRKFEILVQSNHYKINRINTSYYETSVGELLALFNSLNLLEIAIKDGNAADLLSINLNSVIRIKFLN